MPYKEKKLRAHPLTSPPRGTPSSTVLHRVLLGTRHPATATLYRNGVVATVDHRPDQLGHWRLKTATLPTEDLQAFALESWTVGNQVEVRDGVPLEEGEPWTPTPGRVMYQIRLRSAEELAEAVFIGDGRAAFIDTAGTPVVIGLDEVEHFHNQGAQAACRTFRRSGSGWIVGWTR